MGPISLADPRLAPWLGLALAAVVLVLRNRAPRPLRPSLLWVRPAILLALFAASLAIRPPAPTFVNIGLIALAFAAGGFVGWHRGRLTKIEVDGANRTLTARAGPLAVALILVIIAARMALGEGLRGAAARSVGALTNALLAFGVAMVVVQSIEIGLRARRLLAGAGEPTRA